MQDFKRGTVRANQLTFEYLTQETARSRCAGTVPDSPYSDRYLLPASLRQATRAVARSTAGSRHRAAR